MAIESTSALNPAPAEATQRGKTGNDAAPSRWLPSITDWTFAAVLGWMFLAGVGAQALLVDGDSGWHILVGESLLETGQLPTTDPFSFTMEGVRWFAWEWLADLALGAAHRLNGLEGVALLAAFVIAATAALLLRFQLWLGVNLFLAVAATMLTCSVSTIHWLARPHMFTWGFFLTTIWMLEADRRRSSWRVWLLVPLAAIWVNTHGGFVAQLITIGIFAVGVGVEQYLRADPAARPLPPPALLRYLALFGLCLLATLANPWTFELHAHIVGYLQSDFILEHVKEFQSPNFRQEAMYVFEATMLLSALACGLAIRRGEWAWPLLVGAWAHAALTSVRHVPLFMLLAAPFLARELTLLMDEGRRRGWDWLDTLDEIAADYGGRRVDGTSRLGWAGSWFSVLALVGVFLLLEQRAQTPGKRAEFPGFRFPVMACDALADRLEGRRILTTDQWGDYLVYRLHPRYKTFIDGRSDFYAPQIRDDYLALMGAKWNWAQLLERYEFDALLLPVDWALGSVLKEHPDWRVEYDDGQALLFERVGAATESGTAARDDSEAVQAALERAPGVTGDPLRSP